MPNARKTPRSQGIHDHDAFVREVANSANCGLSPTVINEVRRMSITITFTAGEAITAATHPLTRPGAK